VLEIQTQWDDGAALPRDLLIEKLDLVPMKQQLARADGVVVGAVAV
jgi:hypothetical protein